MNAALPIALAITGLVAVPHLLPRSKVAPVSGIVLWSSVLFLRAVLAVCLVVVFVFFIPATQLFSLLTHWCLHAVIPFVATHLGFDGHALGDAAVVVPALITTASLLGVVFGAWRGARAVACWLKCSSLGPGPSSSVIVGGYEVVVAAAGIRSPRVVVSAGALLRLDDAELEAGLEHEWGHVVRRHRLLSLFGHGCRALSRVLPGGKRALAELHMHLERDADDYAVNKTGDPLALASAICKAARAEGGGPALASLAGDGVPERLKRLARSQVSPAPASNVLSRLLALALLGVALALALATPAMASAGVEQLADQPRAVAANCE